MTRALRENALCALMACIGSAVLGWLGLYGFAWNDYDTEVRPAYEALLAGHIGRFLSEAPAYGGSLIERAPFAMSPLLWGGGQLAVYRMAAVPCLLAAAALAVRLNARMRRLSFPPGARAVAVGVCVANPVTLGALEVGHPEDLLGGVLCVAAVMLAARERPLWAGAMLGLAIANKEWALLAAGPVLLALAPAVRLRCVLMCAACAGAVLAPLTLLTSGSFLSSTQASGSSASAIFQPWQMFWFLAPHGAPVYGLFHAVKPGYRTAPAWAGEISHPLILAAGAAVAGLLWLRLRRERASRAGERDALLALALVMLLRCVLDTWDTAYYALPCILALLAWECLGRRARPPVLALSMSVLVWLSFQWLPEHVSADMQSALYLAWSVPLVLVLAARLLLPARAGEQDAQPMTVSSLASAVRIS